MLVIDADESPDVAVIVVDNAATLLGLHFEKSNRNNTWSRYTTKKRQESRYEHKTSFRLTDMLASFLADEEKNMAGGLFGMAIGRR